MPVTTFIAHSSEDKLIVRELHTKLLSIGIKPWLDEVDLIPGQNWKETISAEIKKCDLFLACLTEHSAKTSFLRDEFVFALHTYYQKKDKGAFIVPVKLAPCDIPEVSIKQVNLRDFHWLEYWKEGGFNSLVEVIKKHTLATEFSEWLRTANLKLKVNTGFDGKVSASIEYFGQDIYGSGWKCCKIVDDDYDECDCFSGFAGIGNDLTEALTDLIAQVEGKRLAQLIVRQPYLSYFWEEKMVPTNTVPKRLIRGTVTDYEDVTLHDEPFQ